MSQTLTLPSIGDVVDGKFRVERKLGEGGTSTIYAVRHVITDKGFAIKWLSPELAGNPLAVERFVYEAKVCGRFAHQNAVQIYDVSQSDGSYYLLMELLEGESLDARLERVQRFSVQAACDILLPCAEALDAAHRAGIVHRDLKPSNIFLSRVEGQAGEVPKILDFGISKVTYNGHDLSLVTTTTRTVIGTPQYMSPEQMRGQTAEPRFDVYALGVVLYELIAGERPFECDTFADLVFKIVETQPVPLDRVADVDATFAAIVARAMARNIDDRFPSMAEFAAALRPYGSQRSASAPLIVPARKAKTLAATRSLRKLPSPLAAPLATSPAPVSRPPGAAPPGAAPLEAAPPTAAPPMAVPEELGPDSEITEAGPRGFGRREKRTVAVVAALAIALLVAWQTQAGTPEPKAARAESIAIHRVVPAPLPETPQPPYRSAFEATTPPSPPHVPIETPVRRAPKPVASKPAPKPAKRPAAPDAGLRVDRSDFAEPKSKSADLRLPPAAISRQDF